MTYHSNVTGSSQHRATTPSAHTLTLSDLLQSHQLRVFYGDLHNHTGYSDGTGHPTEALRQMRARGLDFAALTEHGEFFDRQTAVHEENKWAAVAHHTAAFADDGFVALRGFEWSSPLKGHINIWCSAEYTGYLMTGDGSMDGFYEWLAAATPVAGAQVLAGFNHPGREVECFDDCAFAPIADERVVTIECFNRGEDYGDGYFRALDQGWHVGAIGSSDHHGNDWGSPALPRAGVFAAALTLPGLQAALRARRVFATRSPTLTVMIAGNLALMGSRLQLGPREPLYIDVWCDDTAAASETADLELWTNGGTLVAAHQAAGLQQVHWRTLVEPQEGGEHWFAVRVLSDGTVRGYSSPIWARWR